MRGSNSTGLGVWGLGTQPRFWKATCLLLWLVQRRDYSTEPGEASVGNKWEKRKKWNCRSGEGRVPPESHGNPSGINWSSLSASSGLGATAIPWPVKIDEHANAPAKGLKVLMSVDRNIPLAHNIKSSTRGLEYHQSSRSPSWHVTKLKLRSPCQYCPVSFSHVIAGAFIFPVAPREFVSNSKAWRRSEDADAASSDRLQSYLRSEA